MSWTYTGKYSNGSGQLGRSYPSALVSGSVLTACFRINQGTPTGVSDPTNGAWTMITEGPDGDGNTLIYAYFIGNTSTSPETVTLAGTGLSATTTYSAISEYTTTGTPSFQTNADQQNGSTSTVNSSSVTVPAGDMLAVGFGCLGGDAVATANGSFTMRQTSGTFRAFMQDLVNAPSGSLESAPTLSIAKFNIGGILIIGEATAGGIAIPFMDANLGKDLFGGLIR